MRDLQSTNTEFEPDAAEKQHPTDWMPTLIRRTILRIDDTND